MRDVSETRSDFLRDLGDAASRNPLSAALIGMGVVWLFSRSEVGRATNAVRSGFDRATDTAQGVLEGAGSTVRSSVGSAAETLQDSAAGVIDRTAHLGRRQADTLSGYAKTVPDGAAGTIESVGSALADLFRRQPLALGAVGIAAGACIASAFPTTKAEAEYLGEASEAVKEKAHEFTAEQVARAGEAAGKAVHAAADEARKQGLTIEGARSAANEMAAKFERVVDAAEQGASAKADATREDLGDAGGRERVVAELARARAPRP
ncbi:MULTISPECIES: hypothetical protein [Bradyrhizobium]|uniref:hypothetical protein n=1 Tax=Bradyrhizobium elkanii TaxID=29448 RepID=UPI0003FD251A|nr:hypothetical protein [Bradyrhizobium elkanii]